VHRCCLLIVVCNTRNSPSFVLSPAGAPHPFDIQFTCKTANTGNPDMISIGVQATGGDVISIHFHKNCTYPELNVGVTPISAGIVHKGVVQPGFTYIARPDDQASTFYFWMDEESPFNQQLWRVKDLSWDKSVIDIHVDTQPDPLQASKIGLPGSKASQMYAYHINTKLINDGMASHRIASRMTDNVTCFKIVH
jgi:hypothetical protein